MRKRIISACLALCLALSLLPVNVRAAEDEAIATITALADALTPMGGNPPTVDEANSKITLQESVTVSKNLRISCNAEIDFSGQTVDTGSNCIQVDSGKEVVLKGGGTITSSSSTAAVVVMRGCSLTISDVNITVAETAKGYGVLVDPDPRDGKLKTELTLSNMTIMGGQGGVMVHGNINQDKDKEEGNYPVLKLDNVHINWFSEPERIGLYLAGMAKTTVTGKDSEINGAPAIGIKSGTLVIGGGKINSWGNLVADPEANESGIVKDGSAILIENQPGCAGNVNITLDGGAEVFSFRSHAIRELTAEGWDGVPPVIAVKEAGISGVRVEHAQMTVSKDNWNLLPLEPQTVLEYGKNDKYKEAYEAIGLKLNGPTDEIDGMVSYTLDIDKLKLKKLAEADDNGYWKLLANGEDSDELWYSVEFTMPTHLEERGAVSASIWAQEMGSGSPDPEFKDLPPDQNGRFYYPINIFRGDYPIPGSGTQTWVQWTDENGSVLGVSGVTIYLNSKDPYIVYFENCEDIDSIEVSPGDVVPKPAKDPEREGFVFDGWYESTLYKTPWNFETKTVTADGTQIFAKWLEACTVKFDTQDGRDAATKIVGRGRKVPKPDPDPSREKYRFDGWFKEPECENKWDFNSDYVLEKDVYLYAKWLPIHTVTFNSQEGSAVPVQEVVDSGTVPKPTDPTREGYRFDGWFKEAECKNEWNFKTNAVSGPITLYAKWQKTYAVKFDSRGGSEVKPNPQIVDEGKPVTKPANPTKEGFVFDDWYKEEDCLNQWNFDYKVNADVTLYAGWTKAPYTITFHANGGFFTPDEDIVTTPTGEDGKPVEFPADPSRTGYTFDGWYTAREDGEQITTDTVFEKDTTLYAHWKAGSTTPPTPSKPKIYDITFDANGGGSNVTVTTGIDGRLSTLPDPPSYTGHTFEGWYTSASGGTQITKDTVFQGHTTVYAHWKESSGQPSDPSNPSNPSNPSGAQYQIYTPNYTSGGSLYVSRTTAAEGDRVTIRLTPWSGYRLYQLLVTNYTTGRQLSLSRVSANEYAFTMPASGVSVTATFTGGTSSTQSQTTNQSAGWYFSGSSIYHRTSGLVPSGNPLTRDMLISVLYNLDGSSHEEPAVWAVSSGIVPDVYSSLLWGGDKSLTREQTAAILYCYAGYKGYGTSQRVSLAGYTDYSEIRAAAQPAMSWAAAAGLMTGTSASTLSPQANMTCAQAGIVLSRFITSVVRAR